MNPPPKQTLLYLYHTQRLSMTEIANKLHCSVHKIQYWLKKYKIPTRSPSEATYCKRNPSGHPFSIKNKLTPQEIQLKYLALGLYWGEGDKSTHHTVRIGNSDPNIIKLFNQFLITICQVHASKIHFHLQTFKDINPQKARKFWAQQLNLSTQKISHGKPTPSLGKGTYRKISSNGVLTIAVYNTKLKQWIIDELKKIGYNPHDIQTQSWGDGAVKRVGL